MTVGWLVSTQAPPSPADSLPILSRSPSRLRPQTRKPPTAVQTRRRRAGHSSRTAKCFCRRSPSRRRTSRRPSPLTYVCLSLSSRCRVMPTHLSFLAPRSLNVHSPPNPLSPLPLSESSASTLPRQATAPNSGVDSAPPSHTDPAAFGIPALGHNPPASTGRPHSSPPRARAGAAGTPPQRRACRRLGRRCLRSHRYRRPLCLGVRGWGQRSNGWRKRHGPGLCRTHFRPAPIPTGDLRHPQARAGRTTRECRARPRFIPATSRITYRRGTLRLLSTRTAPTGAQGQTGMTRARASALGHWLRERGGREEHQRR